MSNSVLKSGHGIRIDNRNSWAEGVEITVQEVSFDTFSQCIMPYNIVTNTAKPGDVLTVNSSGLPEWRTPFDGDEALRRQYPALEQAWSTLVKSFEEYQMVKKLVADHDVEE